MRAVLRKAGPSQPPAGHVFRLLLIGYFERIDSERGIAWRTADSLALRGFLGLGLGETTPEHSTISRTRRLIDLETRLLVHVGGIPFGTRQRTLVGVGTPRGLQGLSADSGRGRHAVGAPVGRARDAAGRSARCVRAAHYRFELLLVAFSHGTV
jgi:hypothetical protein